MRKAVCHVLAVLLFGAATASFAQTTPSGQPDQAPVFTIITLLIGSAPPPVGSASSTSDAARQMMTVLTRTNWSTLELAQYTEDLATLQDKLKSAFRLDTVDVVSSYGDWLSPGRDMVLEGAGLKLVVTPSGPKDYAQSEVVVHRGDTTSYATREEKARATAYHIALTVNGKPVLTRSWTLTAGTRTILARQDVVDGPLYFVVVAQPKPGVPMRTTWGWEVQTDGGKKTTGSAVVGPNPRQSGSGAGIGVGGSGQAQGVGIGTAKPIEPPKLLYSVKPKMTPEARASGLKGPVGLSGIIAADGSVQDIKILKAVPRLDALAISAFRQWRYEPPPRDENGKPVRVVVTVMMTFDDGPNE